MLRKLAFICALQFMPISVVSADEAFLSVVLQSGETVAMSRAEVEALPETTFTTTTIWTEGEVQFSGVSLADFADALDLEGEKIKAAAINDYEVEIPLEDAVEDGPIIAYHMNGENMSPRDKGPLWIVYPFDAKVEYQSETYYSRSIWQLSRITVAE